MARIAKGLFIVAIAFVVFAPSQAAAQAFSPEQLSEMPSLKSASQAQRAIERAYPRSLQDNGITGKVQVRFVVQADGSVDPSSVEVVAASVKALGEAAADAIAKIEFNPGKKDGTAVAAVVVMPIAFGVS